MTIRTKTIEYGFNQITASVAAVTYGVHDPLVVSIPENTSRTFQSVFAYHYVDQNVAAATSITAVSSSFRLFTDTETGIQSTAITASARTNSGESMSHVWISDLTSYFRSNFSSSFTGMTASISASCQPGASANISSKLFITYTFDDATLTGSNKATKTVRIPLEGMTGSLGTSHIYVVDTVPALATFCPESNKTFRNIFFEFETNRGTSAATAINPVLSVSLGTGPVSTNFGIDDTMASSMYYHGIWQQNNLNVSSSSPLTASTSNTTTNWPCLSTTLVATYDYEPSSTTSILNSITLPISSIGFIGGNTTSLKSRLQTKFIISDSDPVMFVSSAVKLYYSDSGAITLDVRAGNQASRTYVLANTVRAGSLVCQRRIDDAAVGGTGLNLSGGLNTLNIDIFRTVTAFGSLGSGLSGVVLLNYTSSINSGQTETGTKTIYTLLQETPATLSPTLITISSSARIPFIPESYFSLLAEGTYFPIFWGGTALADQWLTFDAQIYGSESVGGGWQNLTAYVANTETEAGIFPVYGTGNGAWKKFPNQKTPNLLNYTSPRQFRLGAVPNSNTVLQGWHVTTYSPRQFFRTGSIYPNPGAGVTVSVHQNDTKELITSASTNSEGKYVVDYISDKIDLYSDIFVSEQQMGRSRIFKTTSSI